MRESPMGPDIHSTDSDKYDSKERGLWHTYRRCQQIRYNLTDFNTVPVTLYVRWGTIPFGKFWSHEKNTWASKAMVGLYETRTAKAYITGCIALQSRLEHWIPSFFFTNFMSSNAKYENITSRSQGNYIHHTLKVLSMEADNSRWLRWGTEHHCTVLTGPWWPSRLNRSLLGIPAAPGFWAR